jgi:hypothetical protein
MATNIGDIRAGIPPRIKDSAGKLSFVAGNGAVDLTKDHDAAIFSALEQYGKARPRQRAKLITGSGAFDYALTGGSPIFPGWIREFSVVVEILFPWDASTPTPNRLDEDEYEVVLLDGDLPYLRFMTAKPAASEQFLGRYTTPHALDTTQSTVRSSDDEALKDLSAAFACDELASFYGHSVDSNIQADSVNNMSKAAEYRAMAKEFRAAYASKMNASQADLSAAAVVMNIERGFSDETDRLFFHGRRFR